VNRLEIVPEVAPIEGELIIDKPGKGAFYATDLDLLLRTQRRHAPGLHGHNHGRLRTHDDARRERSRLRMPAAVRLHRRTDPGNYEAALKMVTMQGGVFGAVATSDACLSAPVQAAAA